jgi:hypothetical protein
VKLRGTELICISEYRRNETDKEIRRLFENSCFLRNKKVEEVKLRGTELICISEYRRNETDKEIRRLFENTGIENPPHE